MVDFRELWYLRAKAGDSDNFFAVLAFHKTWRYERMISLLGATCLLLGSMVLLQQH